MSNSARWRKLMEWLRYCEDNNIGITLKELRKKVEEIKKGE